MSRIYYGGQAVLEGVMMRGPRDMAVAVRAPSGRIVVQTEALSSTSKNHWIKLPIIRGAVALWDTMVLGFRALMFSADVNMEETPAEAAARQKDMGSQPSAEPEKPKMPQGVLWGSMIFALALSVGLFFVTPVLIMGVLDQFLHSSFLSNLIEKIIRLAFILGYIGGIGLLPDVRRVYQYHGAEHKTVLAHEAGQPLDVDHVRPFTTIHPRCGTTFLIVVVLVSFVVFLLLGQPPLIWRVVSRVVLIPFVAGIAYELIRLAANSYDRAWVRALLSPGLAVQKLTTREPDDSQLETAIAALKAVFAAEAARSTANATQPAPVSVGAVA